ncbi:MAG: hypothetical protein AAF791_13110 [Bacteroidota bacterium]
MVRLGLALTLLLLAPSALAQPATPVTPEDTADPADVATTEAILEAVYEVISGEADEPRDWDRFRSLFHPEARLMPLGPGPDSLWRPAGVWSPDEYAELAADIFANAPIFQGKGFYEVESARRVEHYEHLAHVWSTYESRLAPDEEPFAQGINSFQLYHDGTRWWVMSILWEQETPETPIPAPYLPESR